MTRSRCWSVPRSARGRRQLAVQDVDDLLKAGKTKSLSFASVGKRRVIAHHRRVISRKYGLNAIHVPYKGGTPSLTDLMAARSTSWRRRMQRGEPREGRARPHPSPCPTRNAIRAAGVRVQGGGASVPRPRYHDRSLRTPGPAARPIVAQWSDAIGRIAKMTASKPPLHRQAYDVWYKPAIEMETYHRQEVPRLGGSSGSERPDGLGRGSRREECALRFTSSPASSVAGKNTHPLSKLLRQPARPIPRS